MRNGQESNFQQHSSLENQSKEHNSRLNRSCQSETLQEIVEGLALSIGVVVEENNLQQVMKNYQNILP